MFRTLLLILLGICILQNVRAQDSAKSDTLKYYFDADNIETSKDSADHSLFILPKSAKDGGLYPIKGYNKNGNLSLSAFLTTPSLPGRFEGLAISYYPNGNKKHVATYHKGLVIRETTAFFENGKRSSVVALNKNESGEETSKTTFFFPDGNVSEILDFNITEHKGKLITFFPNGRVYTIKAVSPNAEGGYIDCYDSTGVALAAKGNGKLIIYTADFKTAIRSETLKDGIPDKWQPIIDSAAIANFDRSEPIETLVIDKPFFNGARSSFFITTKHDFVNFIQANFEYPKIDIKNRTTGEVSLAMVVEKNGAITHVQIKHGVSKTLADEVARVVQLSAPWTPGKTINGRQVRVLTKLTFKFTLEANSAGETYPYVTIYVANDNINIATLDSAYNKSDAPFLLSNVVNKHEYPAGFAGIKKFIDDNLRYPDEDKKNNIKGKVYVQFIVERDGHVSNAHAISGPSETLKAEGERVVRQLSNWQPGFVNNKPVRVVYTLPVNFLLLKPNTPDVSKAEILPEFPGGLNAFVQFLGDNIKYPAEDREKGISGRVYLTFVVETDGSLSNLEVVRAPSRGLGNEALRVLKKSPKWIPGYQDGKPIKVSYTVPINFNIDTTQEYIKNNIVFKEGINN